MQNRDPNIVYSGLNQRFTRDGVTVEVNIFRLEHETEWLLEVVNAKGTSICWDDPFDSDDAALAEFIRTVEDEGMIAFADNNVVPIPKR